jgi:hypothetical protein
MLEGLGYSRAGASALTGNFVVESGVNLPTAYRNPDKLDHGSQGLAQWRAVRLQQFEDWVKATEKRRTTEPWTIWFGRLDNQVAFVGHELKTSYAALDAKLRQPGDVAALAADVCWQYERPNKALAHIAERVAAAVAISTTTVVDPQTSQTMPAATLGVVDKLHAEADSHAQQSKGAAAIATVGGLGALGLAMSNWIEIIPWWEWAAFAVLALMILIGIAGALGQRTKQAAVLAAIPGVSKVPSGEIQDITRAAAPAPSPIALTAGTSAFDAAVAAAVAHQRSLDAVQAAHDATSKPTSVPGVTSVSATSVSTSVLVDKDGNPVTSNGA